MMARLSSFRATAFDPARSYRCGVLDVKQYCICRVCYLDRGSMIWPTSSSKRPVLSMKVVDIDEFVGIPQKVFTKWSMLYWYSLG
jgi:hypothetical protein